MIKRNETWKRAGPFAAGVLIGLSVVTPVFGATLDGEGLQPLFLLGSLIVLLVGLILKAAATPQGSPPVEARGSQAFNPGDLRWRQSDPAADVALPGMIRT